MQFQTGQTYTTRSICNSDCVFSALIVSRTEKTIKVKMYNDPVKTLRVFLNDGVECVRPFGNYSMSPTLKAV